MRVTVQGIRVTFSGSRDLGAVGHVAGSGVHVIMIGSVQLDFIEIFVLMA